LLNSRRTRALAAYDVLEAETNLSPLIDDVESGREREILIARGGKPAARLVPIMERPVGRRLGVAKGRLKVPETIDEDNALIERLFAGGLD
jgi:antitoxin (DNA-binding transcriptional repressor) of toxin-antitoxin stability system